MTKLCSGQGIPDDAAAAADTAAAEEGKGDEAGDNTHADSVADSVRVIAAVSEMVAKFSIPQEEAHRIINLNRGDVYAALSFAAVKYANTCRPIHVHMYV